jgi:hypothetical protein
MAHPVLRVSSSVRIPNPARRCGQIPPLEVRWQAALDELHAVAPGVPWGQPMTEIGLDDLEGFIAQKRREQEPPPPTPETREAVREVREMQRQFNACALEIKAAQLWLQRARNDWKHQLLKDVTADCFQIPGLYPMGVGEGPQFDSIAQARAAAKQMLPRLQWARGVCAAIKAARSFDTEPKDAQALQLCHALVMRLQESQGRVIAVEAQCAALEAKVNRLERRRNKQSKLPRAA